MAHAHKPDFVFRRNGRVRLNRRRRQFSRLLAAEVCASPVVMLDTPCSEVVWRVLATHSIRQFPLHFPSRTSPCAITFQLESTNGTRGQLKCDGAHAETRFRLSAKRTSPFKSAETSVQSTTVSRGVLDTPCSEVVWRVLATHSIRQFPLHFPSRASPCAITFQLESTIGTRGQLKCDGTRAEIRFRISAKRTIPFKSAVGVSSFDYWQPRCAHQR